ncbi:hypothetical protein, partial [Escherichia coli]
RNRSHWSTSKTPSYTKSVSWHHYRHLRYVEFLPTSATGKKIKSAFKATGIAFPCLSVTTSVKHDDARRLIRMFADHKINA